MIFALDIAKKIGNYYKYRIFTKTLLFMLSCILFIIYWDNRYQNRPGINWDNNHWRWWDWEYWTWIPFRWENADDIVWYSYMSMIIILFLPLNH